MLTSKSAWLTQMLDPRSFIVMLDIDSAFVIGRKNENIEKNTNKRIAKALVLSGEMELT